MRTFWSRVTDEVHLLSEIWAPLKMPENAGDFQVIHGECAFHFLVAGGRAVRRRDPIEGATCL
jgi:hypothetical protein